MERGAGVRAVVGCDSVSCTPYEVTLPTGKGDRGRHHPEMKAQKAHSAFVEVKLD